MNINRQFKNSLSTGNPKEAEKNELFSQETLHYQNFRYEILSSSLL